jgi:hypothetical protein
MRLHLSFGRTVQVDDVHVGVESDTLRGSHDGRSDIVVEFVKERRCQAKGFGRFDIGGEVARQRHCGRRCTQVLSLVEYARKNEILASAPRLPGRSVNRERRARAMYIVERFEQR